MASSTISTTSCSSPPAPGARADPNPPAPEFGAPPQAPPPPGAKGSAYKIGNCERKMRTQWHACAVASACWRRGSDRQLCLQPRPRKGILKQSKPQQAMSLHVVPLVYWSWLCRALCRVATWRQVWMSEQKAADAPLQRNSSASPQTKSHAVRLKGRRRGLVQPQCRVCRQWRPQQRVQTSRYRPSKF